MKCKSCGGDTKPRRMYCDECQYYGYKRASPAKPTTNLDFGQALSAMREGKRVRRNYDKGGWGERRYWYFMANGRLCFHTRGLEAGLVSISTQDALAHDWEILP